MKIEKVEDADLIVIGGGASGLMAAITAAEQGKKVRRRLMCVRQSRK